MRSKVIRTLCGYSIMGAMLLLLTAAQADADKQGDLRREQLAKIKRVAIVPLFFGSDTLREKKTAPVKPAAKSDRNAVEDAPAPEEFRRLLVKMEARAAERLPERLAARTSFALASEEEIAAALKSADMTPFVLFQNQGMMKGTKFVLPETDAVKKFAKSLKADALLLGIMEEPRRNVGGMSGFFSSTPAHVSSRIIYYVLLPDGTDVFHYTIEAVRPLSRTRTRDYTLTDWMETVDQNIESFLDEFARYAPAK